MCALTARTPLAWVGHCGSAPDCPSVYGWALPATSLQIFTGTLAHGTIEEVWARAPASCLYQSGGQTISNNTFDMGVRLDDATCPIVNQNGTWSFTLTPARAKAILNEAADLCGVTLPQSLSADEDWYFDMYLGNGLIVHNIGDDYAVPDDIHANA